MKPENAEVTLMSGLSYMSDGEKGTFGAQVEDV